MNVNSLGRRQLREAANAWQSGGCLGLGHWATKNRLEDWSPRTYGELVARVRAELNDDRDYQEDK